MKQHKGGLAMEESLREILDSFLSHAPQLHGNSDGTGDEERKKAHQTQPRDSKNEPLHQAIKKEWVFETFVTGATNERACLAARRLAELKVTEWNSPFVVAGDTGLGKSHLIHAVANHARTLKPLSRIIYIDARDYTHEYRDAMFAEMPAKRAYEKKYAEAEMILFESLHLFRGPGSQSQFAFVLDQAEQRGAAVIISSLSPVASLKSLSEELRSRLQKADSARIEKPDLDLIVRIALSKAEQLGLSLLLSDAHTLANEAAFDIRALEGFLHTIKSTVELRGCDVKVAIDEWMRCRKTDAAFTPIAMAVSRSFGMTMETIMSGEKKAFDARSAIMVICRLHGISDHHIAWFFGKKQEEITRAITRLHVKMTRNDQLRKHVQQLSADLPLPTDTSNTQRF